MTDTTFAGLGLAEPLGRALDAHGYTTPTPIQAQAIPALLTGGDVIAVAQTGTGKTAAFGLPLMHRLCENGSHRQPKSARALILAPTRELAIQITDELTRLGQFTGLKHATIFGGVGQNPQVRTMAKGVDVLVATPGRLLDLMQQRHVHLRAVEMLVLDEADRMLDMGFVRDVRRIVKELPTARQSLLFSATMPSDVAKLAGDVLHAPARIEVTPETVAVERIEQQVHHVDQKSKRRLLVDLLSDGDLSRVIVFTRTKHGANRVSEHLEKAAIRSAAIHGNKSQSARQASLEAFRTGDIRVLVATDIAARGIDVSAVSHVINFDLPNVAESYVHRIGRTARAGAGGNAVSFCDASERAYLRDIEKLIGFPIPASGHTQPDVANEDRPSRSAGKPNQPTADRPKNGSRRRNRRPRRNGSDRRAA